jgi:hypothetical protein
MKRNNTEPRPYPPSRGEKAAARIRAKANTLSDERRAELMTVGMQVIYGGQHRAQVRPGSR